MPQHEPTIFVSYRRADEPFAAGLLGVTLFDRYGQERVFLDTLSLRSRRGLERKLLARVRSSTILLALIGSRWDDVDNRERLYDECDWVRQEILEAHHGGVPVVPVLVERTAPLDADSLPGQLMWLTKCASETITRAGIDTDLNRLVDRIQSEVRGASIERATALEGTGTGLDPETVRRATLAMLRHVLPRAQRRMRNDEMVARVVSAEFEASGWLRFAAAGRLPDRPRGSGS